MSGITPLIDTLMHQVLGRQGESSQQRSINAPVQPVTPGDGPRALSRDAGLDGRPPAQPLTDELRRLPPSLDPRERGPANARGEAPPGSTQTHFSSAARSIADVLLRFPAPPTVLRLNTPLMPPGEPASADALAQRLSASIRDSGLFYESHLKRWFEGDLVRLQLMREPQMQLARPFAAGQAPALGAGLSPSAGPAPSALLPDTPLRFVQAAPASAGALAPLSPLAASAHVAGSTQAPAGGQLGAAPGPLATTPAPLVEGLGGGARDVGGAGEFETSPALKRDIVHESLQPLVRQQLEMLATPTLRWEGDVWAGIFMALVINLPGGRARGQHGDSGGEADTPWHSQMHLDVPAIGAFDVALTLVKSTLGVDVTTRDGATHQRLSPAMEALETRLGALDFTHVRVTLKPPTEEA